MILRPIDQFGWSQRLLDGRRRDALARPGPERSARRGEDDAADVLARPAPIAWKIALCSESTGSTRAPGVCRLAHEERRRRRRGIPCWRARRSRRASAAANVGRKSRRADDRRHHPVGRALAPLRSWRSSPAPTSMPRSGKTLLELVVAASSATAAKRAPNSRASLASASALRCAVDRLDAEAARATPQQIDGADRRSSRSRRAR